MKTLARLIFLLVLFVVAFTVAPQQSRAQTVNVLESALLAVQRDCQTLEENIACYASGELTAEGASLQNPGDVVPLDGLQTLRSAPANEDEWGVSVIKLAQATGETLTLVMLGEAEITNTFDPTTAAPECFATNLNVGNVNIHVQPNASQTILNLLEPQQAVPVKGVNAAGDWFQVETNRTLGWMGTENIALSCERTSLPTLAAEDVRALYQQPMQQITLKTGADVSDEAISGLLVYSGEGEKGQLLVNGVQIDVNGAVFLKADSALTVQVIQGKAAVAALGSSVTVSTGQTTSIPLTDFAASGVPDAVSENVDSGNVSDVLNSAIFGQAYRGPKSTVAGLSLGADVTGVAENDLVRVNISFSGDAAQCPTALSTPADVVFVLDVSDTLTETQLALMRSGLAATMDILQSSGGRYGIVAFRNQAKTIAKLDEPLEPTTFEGIFDSTVATIAREDAGTESAFNTGLATALTLFKQAESLGHSQTIILVSDGTGNLEQAQPIVEEVRNRNINLVSVGVGDTVDRAFMTALATTNFVPLASMIELPDMLQNLTLQTARNVVVSDFELAYSFDAADYELVSAFAEGGTVNGSEIAWQMGDVREGQVMDFPVVLRAKRATGSEAGNVQVSYACSQDNSLSVADQVPVPTLAGQPRLGSLTTARQGVLSPKKSSGAGVLRPFSQNVWAVEAQGSEMISIITGGTDSPPIAVLSDAEPLYTLDNFDGSGRRLNVFYLAEDTPRWLYLQSANLDSSGQYEVSVEMGAVEGTLATLEVDGARLDDKQEKNQGRLYALAANPGDILTFRYAGAALDIPFRVFSMNGQPSIELYSRYDTLLGQWVSVQALQGSAPYRVVVKSDEAYAIEAASGDTITNPSGRLSLGESLAQPVLNDNPIVVSYELEVTEPRRIGLLISGEASAPTLLNVKNQRLDALEQIQVNTLKVNSFDLDAGNYTVYLEVSGNFAVDVTTIEGNLADAVGDFKGSLILDKPQEDAFEDETPLGIYSLSPGTGKPLFEGDTLTIFMNGVDNAGRNTVFIRSADNVPSEITLDYTQPTESLYISVHELRGEPPYQVVISGQDSYTVTPVRGDLLSSDKGSLVVGQNSNDSSPSPQFLTYTLAPELGKQLVEGDIVTVSFTNRGNDDTPFELPLLKDAGGNGMPFINAFLVGRRFVGAFELMGKAPYRLEIPNVGAYSVGLDIGNTIVAEEGELKFDDEWARTTEGPQIVEYTIEGKNKDVFTLTLRDPRGAIDSGSDFQLKLFNSAGEIIAPEVNFIGSGTIKAVFTLPADDTYKATFNFDGTYIIGLVEGDEVTVDKGVFFLGDAEITEIEEEEEGKVLIYTLQIDTPMELTIFQRGAGLVLYDPDNDTLSPKNFLFTYASRQFLGTANIYEVEKIGQYRLLVSAQGFFTLSIVPENTITVDKGNVYFGVTETDQLEEDIRFAKYTINAQEGETVSVQFSMENVQRARRFLNQNTVIMLDAEGTPISIDYRVTDEGYRFLAYELVGPAPYTLLIQPQRLGVDFFNGSEPHAPYVLTVTQGNTVRVLKGAAQSENVGEIKEEDGRRTAVYDFTANEPMDLTLELITDEAADANSLRVVDANGERVPLEAVGFNSSDDVLELYRLPAAGAYTLEFEVTGEYTLNLYTGDAQTVDFGTVQINPRDPVLTQAVDRDGNPEVDDAGNPVFEDYIPLVATNELTGNQIVAYYTIDAPEGEVVSVLVDVPDGTRITLRDANQTLVPILDTSADSRLGTIVVYQLLGTPPYRLRLENLGRGEHTVRVDAGNVLVAELGVLPLNPENPDLQPVLDSQGQPEVDDAGNPVFEEYVPIITEAELETPALVANYTIDSPPGSVVTLQLDQSGNDSPDPFVLNGDFELLRPRDSVADGGSITQVYELVGQPPYRVLFVPNRQYTVTLTQGDKLVAAGDVLPIGILDEPFSREISLPARIAEHTIEVEAGRLVTVQIQSGRSSVPMDLVDANGDLLRPEIRFFEEGNNVAVYLTSGVAPYTLRLVPDGEYEITTVTSNLVRVDLGFIQFDAETTGELEAPARVATYEVDAKRDEIVTVYLQDNRQPTFGEFRDANGRLWQPELAIIQDNGLFAIYELGGPPPYQLTFSTTGEYNIQVFETNVLRSDMGDVPFGEDIEGELEAPARTAVYTIPAEPGELVTIALQIGRDPGGWLLYDADDNVLDPLQVIIKEDTTFGIYTMAGNPPYTLEFNADGNYTLNVSRDNALVAELGTLTFNEETDVELVFPQEIVIYELDRPAGQVVSIAVGEEDQQDFKLTDAESNELKPDAEIIKNRTTYRVYTLAGAAPYTISFTALTERFSMTVSDGNVLRADQGVIRFGNSATAQLEEPQEAAIYIIDGVPNQIISVSLTDRNRPLSGELIDSSGKEVLPFGQAIINNRDYRTFVLSGTPPYRYVFFPEGRYTLQLEEGNIFRTDFGVVPFGSEITNRLVAPARTAAYTINTESDQIISVTIASRGREFVIPELLNTEGETLVPLAEVYEGTNTYTGVYLLTGSAPYTLSFETTDQYTFSLARENVTEVELDPIGPEAPVIETEDD